MAIRTEHARLVEPDTAHWFDALLARVPLRTKELAAPPPGSDLVAVRGDAGLPLLGLGIHTVRYGPAFQIQLLRRHGPVSWWRAFGRTIIAASGPEATQIVLSNKDKAFATGWPRIIGPWFDEGLLAMDSTEHLTHRRLMQAAYTEDALAGYLRYLTEDVNAALSRWPTGREFKAVPAIRALSSQITTRAFLGLPYHQNGRKIMDAVETCIRAETALFRLAIPGTLWHRAHRARRWLAGSLSAAVPVAQARAGEDFFSVLSRIDGFTTRQLAYHMLFTLIASHDTTTSATLAAIYFLGKHPIWQDRARTDSSSTLDAIIKESIRLVSPSPILMRVTVKDTELLGHYIPAGHLVSVCTAVNQLLPELWPNPNQFDPSRFLTPNGAHRLSWAPFGHGAHKCIGMRFGTLKVKATLNALLHNFKWTFPPAYEAPWRFTSLPAPTDGLPLTLHPA